jgi:hypothetical protein
MHQLPARLLLALLLCHLIQLVVAEERGYVYVGVSR